VYAPRDIWENQRRERHIKQVTANMCDFMKAHRGMTISVCKNVFGLTFRQVWELIDPDTEWVGEDPEVRRFEVWDRRRRQVDRNEGLAGGVEKGD
jgi:hypothetical protein